MLDIVTLQDEILEKMGFKDLIKPEIHQEILLLDKILNCDYEDIESLLGKFGRRFKAFVSAVDLKHPHVKVLFDDFFTSDPDFYQYITELLELMSCIKEKKLTKILPSINNKFIAISKNESCRNILKNIDSPLNNRFRIRLLSNRKDRDRLRSEKKIQTIDLNVIIKKGEDVWTSQPDKFDNFIRGGISYKDQINYAEKKMKRYADLGCSCLAKQIFNSIEQFKDSVHEVYYGFNRITITNAAVILAKMLGYKLSTTWLLGENERKIFFISAPQHLFEDYFEENASTAYGFDYEPRIYPVDKLPISFEHINKIIDHLEEFPEACGKAIFDNYAILVPGITCPVIKNDCKYFINKKGFKLDYYTKEEAAQALDIHLINYGYITPILLGEKDGKCFFVSFCQVKEKNE